MPGLLSCLPPTSTPANQSRCQIAPLTQRKRPRFGRQHLDANVIGPCRPMGANPIDDSAHVAHATMASTSRLLPPFLTSSSLKPSARKLVK